MGETSVRTTARSLGVPRPVMAVVAGVVAALLIATAAMWLHYGTAVFYEIVTAGIAMCL
jgi:hypothetical protein